MDFHGTICNDRYWRSLAAEHQQALQAFLFERNVHLVDEWMRGRHTAEAINELIAAELDISYESLWSIFVADCRSMHIPADILSCLKRLRSLANVVLITGNMDSFTRFTVPALGLDRYFDAISNSFDEGILKTDDGGALFSQYADRFGSPIAECVVVDDAEDVCAAFATLGGTALRVTSERPTQVILDSLLSSWSNQGRPVLSIEKS